MASGQTSGVKRFLLWDYPRASWQYDVMVALILAFVFLTPRTIFRDQRRVSSIVELPSGNGRAFMVEPGLLESVPDTERKARVEGMLRSDRFGNNGPIEGGTHSDPEQEISGIHGLHPTIRTPRAVTTMRLMQLAVFIAIPVACFGIGTEDVLVKLDQTAGKIHLDDGDFTRLTYTRVIDDKSVEQGRQSPSRRLEPARYTGFDRFREARPRMVSFRDGKPRSCILN